MLKLAKYTKISVGIIISLLFFLGGISQAKAADPLLTDEVDEAEENSVFHFTGSIIELEQTTPPTTILVRDSSGSTTIDYIVEIDADTVLARSGDFWSSLSFWLVGDVVKVFGYQVNEETVHSNVIINTSITGVSTWTQNGWIKETNCDENYIILNWQNKDWRVEIVPNATRIIIPPNSRASCDDLRVNDRVRGRGTKHETQNTIQARTIFVLRRGATNYVKRQTERINGTLLELEGTTAPTTARIRSGGADFTIQITEKTKIRQRFWGKGSLDEWIAGDNVTFLVKRKTSSSGTLTAVMAKNNSIWKVSSRGFNGVIKSIDSTTHTFVMRWSKNNKLYRIDVRDTTHIIKDTINPATFDDLEVGDIVRGRGEKHARFSIIVADIIVARSP